MCRFMLCPVHRLFRERFCECDPSCVHRHCSLMNNTDTSVSTQYFLAAPANQRYSKDLSILVLVLKNKMMKIITIRNNSSALLFSYCFFSVSLHPLISSVLISTDVSESALGWWWQCHWWKSIPLSVKWCMKNWKLLGKSFPFEFLCLFSFMKPDIASQ